MFIDKTKILVTAGNGGDGLASFRHEKYVALGGPFGGDGGNGGNVIFKGDSNKTTLLDLRYKHHLKAGHGENGKNKKMHGANGSDLIINVPLGTIVKRLDTNQIIGEVTQHDQLLIVACGGSGGRGNSKMATSKNPAPNYAEKGTIGESFEIEAELKLLADVGLVGFPSAGKSTLLSVVSAAKPEIADYPFTTLIPQLGMVATKDNRSFVMADLPGIIEYASSGKGLGLQFLKHIERTKVLVHLVDMSGYHQQRNPIDDYQIIMNELKEYSYNLLERKMIVVASKMDLEESKINFQLFKQAYPDLEVIPISSMTNNNLDQLLYKIADELDNYRLIDAQQKPIEEEEYVYKFIPKKQEYEIEQIDEYTWRLFGDLIDREFYKMNQDSEDSIMYFSNRMSKLGIDQFMRNSGVKNGDIVILHNIQFEFWDE